MAEIMSEVVLWILVLCSLPSVYAFFRGAIKIALNQLWPVNEMSLRVIEDGKVSYIKIRDDDARNLINAILQAGQNAKN